MGVNPHAKTDELLDIAHRLQETLVIMQQLNGMVGDINKGMLDLKLQLDAAQPAIDWVNAKMRDEVVDNSLQQLRGNGSVAGSSIIKP